jgi:hypothetical protein
MELLIGNGRRWRGLKFFHNHSLDEHPRLSDQGESAASGPFWLVNQRYGRLILPIPLDLSL